MRTSTLGLLAAAVCAATFGLLLLVKVKAEPAAPSPTKTPAGAIGVRTDRPARIAPSTDGPAPAQPEPEPQARREAREREADRDLTWLAQELRRSGAPAGEPWAAQPAAILDGFRDAAEPALAERVAFSAVECHAGGCLAVATYRDFDSYMAVNDVLPASEAFRAYPGARMRSRPVTGPDGRVTATWFFLGPQPQPAAEPLQSFQSLQ